MVIPDNIFINKITLPSRAGKSQSFGLKFGRVYDGCSLKICDNTETDQVSYFMFVLNFNKSVANQNLCSNVFVFVNVLPYYLIKSETCWHINICCKRSLVVSRLNCYEILLSVVDKDMMSKIQRY